MNFKSLNESFAKKYARPMNESVSVGKIANFLKKSVNFFKGHSDYTLDQLDLGNNLILAVGWSGGYDEDDESGISPKDGNEWKLNAAIKIKNPSEWDFEFLYMPWNPETGEVWDTSITLSDSDDYTWEADFFAEEYQAMCDEMKNEHPQYIFEGKLSLPKLPAHNKMLNDTDIDASIDDYDADMRLDDDKTDVDKFIRRATGVHEGCKNKGKKKKMDEGTKWNPQEEETFWMLAKKKLTPEQYKDLCKTLGCSDKCCDEKETVNEDVMDTNYRSMLSTLNRALLLLETYVDYSEDYTYSKEEDKKILNDALTAYKELRNYIKQ